MSYEIYLLGNFKILKDGKEITIPYKKISYIIAYLTIEGKCSRSVISELFWESYDNQMAKKNLRNAVYNIKKLLGDDFLICHGRTAIEINSELVNYVDIKALQNLKDEEYVKSYKQFMQGHFLSEGYNIERWSDKINDDLLRKYSDYASKLIGEHVNDGEFDKALDLISDSLIYNAYDENLYRLAMKIYRNQNRYSEAIAFYRKLAHALESEFALKPEKQTRELFEEITMLRANEVRKSDDESFVADMESVNKIREIINENDTFNISKSIFIYGEAGVGKNSLIEYSINDDIRAKYDVYNIKCNLNENDFAYNSIYYLLKKLDDEDIDVLLNQVFMMSIELIGGNKFNFNASIHDVIVDKLVRFFNQRKSLLIINEFCSMDSQSKMIINEVFKLSSIVVIVTSRKEKCMHKPSCNNFCKNLEYIHIKLLTLEQVREYLESKNYHFSESKLQDIYKVSQGNRLLIDGIIENALSEITSYSQVIDEGVLNVSAQSRRLLDLISIFNYSVKFEDLAAIYSDSELELVEQLEYLISLNILRVESNSKGNYYSFKYSILKEYIYTKIDKIKRSQYHSLIASFYKKKHANNLTIHNIYKISYHYKNTNNQIQALKYSLLYLFLASTSSLEIFPSATYKKYSIKDINDQLIIIEEKMEGLDVEETEEYFETQLYLVLVKLYLRVSSFKTRGVMELIDLATLLAKKSNKEELLETVYLLQLFYAQNTANAQLFRATLDNLKKYKIYYSIHVRMEAYYLFLVGDVERAIEMLENRIFDITEEDTSQLFATYIYLSEFLIATKNYKRALSKLSKAQLIDDSSCVSSSGQALLYGYLVICYYKSGDIYKAKQVAPRLLELLDSSNVAWKKALFYSYIYLLNNKDKQYYNLSLKYYRKSLQSDELKQINSNLELDE